MLQQLLCLHDLYLQLLRHYDLYCRNHYYATKALYYCNYYVPTIYTYSSYEAIIYLYKSMHSIPSYYNHNTTSYDDRLPAAGGPPPMRAPGAARRTLHQLTKTMNYVLLYCFSVLPFVLLISTRRPISREDAHRMYPRYQRVFSFLS